MGFTTDRGDYDRVSIILRELADEGLEVPDASTVRRWVPERKIRAYKVGGGRGCLLVSREDVRRLVTPIPVGAQ